MITLEKVYRNMLVAGGLGPQLQLIDEMIDNTSLNGLTCGEIAIQIPDFQVNSVKDYYLFLGLSCTVHKIGINASRFKFEYV